MQAETLEQVLSRAEALSTCLAHKLTGLVLTLGIAADSLDDPTADTSTLAADLAQLREQAEDYVRTLRETPKLLCAFHLDDALSRWSSTQNHDGAGPDIEVEAMGVLGGTRWSQAQCERAIAALDLIVADLTAAPGSKLKIVTFDQKTGGGSMLTITIERGDGCVRETEALTSRVSERLHGLLETRTDLDPLSTRARRLHLTV